MKLFLWEKEFMKNRLVKPFVAGGVFFLFAAVLAGCATCKPGKPGPVLSYTIEVSLDESLKSSSVIVDLVGVNPSSLPRWEAYDMGKYWKEGDPMRRDADKMVLNFVSGQSLTRTMSITDAQWNKWKSNGVSHVMVLADLPGMHTSKPGNQDPRRQILALDQCSWPDKTTTLKVLVQRSGMVVVTPARAVK
ncbi:MAG: hypothetical protein ABI651_09875 [Verrucomicrobiota bacterium]